GAKRPALHLRHTVAHCDEKVLPIFRTCGATNMFTSILLHLEGGERAPAVIDAGVRLARRHAARVRGLSLTDTRHFQSLASTCESAAGAVTEHSRLRLAEKRYSIARADLTQACLAANLNFDVRTLSGDPFELLPQE